MKRLLAVAILLLAGCGSSAETTTEPPPTVTPPPPAATAQVEMRSQSDAYGDQSHSFVPAQVRIARGGTVTWNNGSGFVHNVTFDAATGAPGHVPEHASGTNSRVFPTAGNFPYRCTFHAGMTGTVEVVN